MQDLFSKFSALWYQIVIQITNVTTLWDKIVILFRHKTFDTVSQICGSLLKLFAAVIENCKSHPSFYHPLRENCDSFWAIKTSTHRVKIVINLSVFSTLWVKLLNQTSKSLEMWFENVFQLSKNSRLWSKIEIRSFHKISDTVWPPCHSSFFFFDTVKKCFNCILIFSTLW